MDWPVSTAIIRHNEVASLPPQFIVSIVVGAYPLCILNSVA